MKSSESHCPILPLSMVNAGEAVELIDICEHSPTQRRLCELGMTPGACLRVLRGADATGLMIVAVRQDARLAVDRRSAHKIMVRLQEG